MTTWDCTADNYGLEGDDTLDRADNLESLLDTLASFLPGPYITHKITKTSTNISSVWDIIWEHYDVKPSQATFLDYNELSMSSDDRPIDLYDKMIYHAINHLCPVGTDGGAHAGGVLTQADKLTLSHRNLVALNWLNKINPKLVPVVKVEYSKDLKDGKPLSSLVKNISENMDSLLAKANTLSSGCSMIQDSYPSTPTPDSSVQSVCRIYNQPYQPGPRYNVRGRGQFFTQQRPTFNPRQQRPSSPASPFCQSCFSLGKKLSLKVDFKHQQKFCPQLATVRAVTAEVDAHIQEPELDNQEDTFDDSMLNPDAEGKTSMTSQSSPWTSKINSVKKIEGRIQNEGILKAKSPSAKVSLFDTTTYCIIDEGSELCCIDQSLASSLNLPFSRTSECAMAAGSTSMTLIGETDSPIILKLSYCKFPIEWNLGNCVIVRNLGCPILIGEPGKSKNNIITDPTKKLISTVNVNNQKVTFPYLRRSNIVSNSFMCRTNDVTVVYPRDVLSVPVPSMYAESQQLFFTPRRESTNNSPPPQVCQVNTGKVNLVNHTDQPLLLKKNSHFGDLVSDVSVTPNIIQDSTSKANNKSPLPSSTPSPHSHVKDTKVDPDDILDDHWKSHFTDMLHNFSDVIDPNPGQYNNYFGNVDCSINFVKLPPASIKARLPSYSHEKLVEMGKMMDQMEKMGVLAKPEDIGVIPKNVHTSYLVPKTDGRYRFVTDFTNLLPFIGKLEVITPSISQAKRIISDFKFHAELDLSHCFWQGSMSPSDSQYLATPHPFGGLRVYCREPQGIRNASEHNSERLARIFGDLEMDRKMCRMADGLYVGGSTLEELSDNLATVFNRARLAGLTFKPSKIIICPKETILFGWKKSCHNWSPTNHVISPLSQAPLPKTVKQLRGFIGAYRQLSSTIKDHAVHLSHLEKLVGGKPSREQIKWDDNLTTEFEKAKHSLTSIKTISIPKPTDTLHIYPDFSETANAVGSHLVIKRDNEPIEINGGYFSVRLEDCQTRWTPCEKECLGIKLSIEHFKPFIQNSNNRTIIHTDNLICVQAWNRLKQGQISSSSKVASFLSSLSENNVEIVHFPGSKTKVADFSSRNPLRCEVNRCQICSYASEQTTIGDYSKIMSVTVNDIDSGAYKIPLSEKPTWLKLQKEDDTHKRLYKLITSGGLQPEPKLRGHTDLKRLYNLYRRGLLNIDNLGLITVKHIDTKSGIEYDAISVPTHLFPSLIQSLHIKLNHPSRAQLHKFVSRHFFCIGVTHTIDSVHLSCEICASLAILPKPNLSESTTPNPVFGSNFSADIMVSEGQKIFICREKLSQFAFTKILYDETADSIRDAIVDSIVQIMPSSGATIRLDPSPAHQSLFNLQNDDLLKKFNIQIELGRTHNANKNPIAENGVKEFRKERLRLNKQGGPITELDRITITRNLNQRIRNRGLASKEIYHRRSLTDNNPINISDIALSDQQYQLRTASHKQPSSQDKAAHRFQLGDRVLIKGDLTKLRGREEYLIVQFYSKDNEQWAQLRKSEKSLRDKTYDLKLSEIVPASLSFTNTPSLAEPSQEPFQGFPTTEIPVMKPVLKKEIDKLQRSIPPKLGRPSKQQYPDYINTADDLNVSQPFYGFPSQSYAIATSQFNQKVPPTHGWDQSLWFQMLDESFFDCFAPINRTSDQPRLDDLQDLLESSPENRSPPLHEHYQQDYWEDQDNLDVSDQSLPVCHDMSVTASIESSDLTLIDPSWDSPISLFRKHTAAKKIQRFWRQHLLSQHRRRYKSSTDPYFLVRIPVVDDSESDFSDDTFYSPHQSRPGTPILSHYSQPIQADTVYNISQALDSLQLPTDHNQVQDVSSTLDALDLHHHQRPRRNVQRHNYKTLNAKGFVHRA